MAKEIRDVEAGTVAVGDEIDTGLGRFLRVEDVNKVSPHYMEITTATHPVSGVHYVEAFDPQEIVTVCR